MKKSEKEYLNKIASLGCIICKRECEIHHLRTGVGMGQRNDNNNVIGLCPEHHRTGGHGVAYHAGRLAFEANFGTELELLQKTKDLL